MLLLTAAVYAPELFLARGVAQQVIAINFVADTLLFAGTLLAIGCSIVVSKACVTDSAPIPERSLRKSSTGNA